MTIFRRIGRAAPLCAALSLAGCQEPPPQAVGTLEYDRISLPAPAAERILRIDVREGQRVAAGEALMQLEATRTRLQLDALRAQAAQRGGALEELQAGPRSEAIDQARATLAAATAQAEEARAYHQRLRPLAAQQLVATADLDRARAAADQAQAQLQAQRAALRALERGSRIEQIAQGTAAVAAAQAEADVQAESLRKLEVVAPRAGRIDSLPYRPGDQAPVGASLVTLLVGEAPYARVYVPQPLRAAVKVGDAAQVFVGEAAEPLQGRVRMIRSEPSFTPYYALIGEDAARLSYLAEVQLTRAAGELPAGLPARVEFERPAP
jgi:HlyD family secretion protein